MESVTAHNKNCANNMANLSTPENEGHAIFKITFYRLLSSAMQTTFQLLKELTSLEKHVISEIQNSAGDKNLDVSLDDLLKTKKALIAEKLFRNIEFTNNFQTLQEKYKAFSQHQILKLIDIVKLNELKVKHVVSKVYSNWSLKDHYNIIKPDKLKKNKEKLLFNEVHYERVKEIVDGLKGKFANKSVLKKSLFYQDLLEIIDNILSIIKSYISELNVSVR